VTEHRKAAQRAIRAILVPQIRALGFSGAFPHFRRATDSEYHTLSILFDKYGEGFYVEGGRTTFEQFERLAKDFSPPLAFEKLNVGTAFRRVRFGSPTFQDHVFEYRAWSNPEQFEIVAKRAAEAVQRDAETFYSAV
jgi:hypothetical protein